ncbi:hypothetical protein GCM10017744_074980 [Streptomyces antimycoticus]|uniref:Uncharacterized protein n=1 Tax=Streptomyces antimycoticus TaxID=68175 RepID=A0A4D4K0R1_9ACTN|nr:hypothetical protein SANT12839_026560 [Streptomyces antimycoticus]
MTRGAEHHGVALGAATVGMRAGVDRARVCLDLGQAQFDRTVRSAPHQEAAQEVGRDLQNGSVEEGAVEGLAVRSSCHAARA